MTASRQKRKHKAHRNAPLCLAEVAVLRPFDRREALTPAEAAEIAGKHQRTILLWCEKFGIGRRVVGTWLVSRVALAMLLDDSRPALTAYLAGDRNSALVAGYFERAGLSDLLDAEKVEKVT
jgi:hypothetical protein